MVEQTVEKELIQDKWWSPSTWHGFWEYPLIFAIFFQAGLFLVDSPGLGENEVMDQRTRSYVREAVAFIYLINCESGGGYSEGRVSLEIYFAPRCSFFGYTKKEYPFLVMKCKGWTCLPTHAVPMVTIMMMGNSFRIFCWLEETCCRGLWAIV